MMEQQADILVSIDPKKEYLEYQDEIILPFPIQALVVNVQEEGRERLKHALSLCRNFSWKATASLSPDVCHDLHADRYHIILLTLPKDDYLALAALKSAAEVDAEVILLGDNASPRVLRQAFQQGVCDFIPDDVPLSELHQALKQVAQRQADAADLAPVLAIINGKAGSGASFIATSLASIIAEKALIDVALLDTDLQYGTLAHMLGVTPKNFITNALEQVTDLDEVALNGIMTSRKKLHLLAAKPFSLLEMPLDASQVMNFNNLTQLILKCRLYYQHLIVDFSRGAEAWNVPILDNAKIFIVVQQNVMSIMEAKGVVQQLTLKRGIAREQFHLLVNRYNPKDTTIRLDDIKETVGIDSAHVVSNDFKIVNQCTDMGSPITEIASRQRILRDLKKIADLCLPNHADVTTQPSGFWARLLGR